MTTEDEVMRLLRRADPDRGRADAPFTDGTDYLVALRTRSTTVTLIDAEPTPSKPESRHRWPIIAVAAAAVVAVVVGGLVIATLDDDPTGEAPAAQPTTVAPTTVAQPSTVVQPATVAQPPVEFTACVNPGPEFQSGTAESSQVSVPDGEMTIVRGRGSTWRSTVRDVSDPRLVGAWYNSFDGDAYTLPGGDQGPSFGTSTHRIENDEGAWQGSFLEIDFADGESIDGPLLMIGEGAYEGLTAVGIINFGAACPNTRGYIIEGSVPAPPVPQTGQ